MENACSSVLSVCRGYQRRIFEQTWKRPKAEVLTSYSMWANLGFPSLRVKKYLMIKNLVWQDKVMKKDNMRRMGGYQPRFRDFKTRVS